MKNEKIERKGRMTVEEAGRKGGEKTSATHGRSFYEEIGRKGGEKTSSTHGKEFYEEIGKKGGVQTAATHGREFYEEIGRKGGEHAGKSPAAEHPKGTKSPAHKGNPDSSSMDSDLGS